MNKILNIIQCANLGGMERASFALSDELKIRNFDITYFSLNPDGGLGLLLSKLNIPLYSTPYTAPLGFWSAIKARNFYNIHKPTIVFLTGLHFLTLLMLPLSAKKNTYLFVHFHHRGVKNRCSWILIYFFAWLKTKSIIFPTNMVLEEAVKIFPPIKNKSHLVENAIKVVDRLNKINIKRSDFVIGNAGWFIERKRWDIFFDIAFQLLQIDPTITFQMAGDGPLRMHFEITVKNSGFEKNFSFKGWVNDMDEFYNSIDLLLFNSDADVFGMTPVEALLHGRFVVASILYGGLKAYTEKLKNITLYETHDVAKMVFTILKYKSLLSERKANSLKDIELLRKLFSPNVVGDKIEALINA